MVLATISGILGACVALSYSILIEHGLYFLWTTLPEMIHQSNLFGAAHCVWITPTICMLFWTFLARLLRADLPNMNMNKWIDCIVANGGVKPIIFGHAVYLLSCINIVGGSSVGPEAPLVFVGSALGSKVAKFLNEDPESTRCLSFCGGAATLAIFWGFPIACAFFVLEIPHPNGYEHFELLPASI